MNQTFHSRSRWHAEDSDGRYVRIHAGRAIHRNDWWAWDHTHQTAEKADDAAAADDAGIQEIAKKDYRDTSLAVVQARATWGDESKEEEFSGLMSRGKGSSDSERHRCKLCRLKILEVKMRLRLF